MSIRNRVQKLEQHRGLSGPEVYCHNCTEFAASIARVYGESSQIVPVRHVPGRCDTFFAQLEKVYGSGGDGERIAA